LLRQKNSFRFIKYLFLKYRFRKKHLKGTTAHKIFGEYLFDHDLWLPSKDGITKGIALGLFFGLLPIYGFQIISCIAIAILIRANLSATVLFTFITNPITAPAILISQYKFGKWIMCTSLWQSSPFCIDIPNSLISRGEPLLIGSSLSAILVAFCGYILSIICWDLINSVLRKAGSKAGVGPR
jgi:uncharacterized protein (DUF2062 family)